MTFENEHEMNAPSLGSLGSEHSLDAAQSALTQERVLAFLDFTRKVEASLILTVDDPDSSSQHRHLESIRLLSRLARQAQDTAIQIGGTANSEPNPVSVPQIANALHLSINTTRTRLGSIGQNRPLPDDIDPFTI